MTAFSQADVPASVTTVESLIVWATGILYETTGNTSVVEIVNGIPEPVAQSPIIEDTSRRRRVVCRASIELDNAYITDNTKKFWEHAIEFNEATIPNAFKA